MPSPPLSPPPARGSAPCRPVPCSPPLALPGAFRPCRGAARGHSPHAVSVRARRRGCPAPCGAATRDVPCPLALPWPPSGGEGNGDGDGDGTRSSRSRFNSSSWFSHSLPNPTRVSQPAERAAEFLFGFASGTFPRRQQRRENPRPRSKKKKNGLVAPAAPSRHGAPRHHRFVSPSFFLPGRPLAPLAPSVAEVQTCLLQPLSLKFKCTCESPPLSDSCNGNVAFAPGLHLITPEVQYVYGRRKATCLYAC